MRTGITDKNPPGTAAYETLPFTCRCKKRWSGGRAAHCGTCHQTFGGVSNFDLHRVGGHCTPPEQIGLTLLPGRAFECWGSREDEPPEV